MKILFDIYHIAEYNFFKESLTRFGKRNIDIFLVNRKPLIEIVNYELEDYNTLFSGDYSTVESKTDLVLKVILPRLKSAIKLLSSRKYKLVISASYQCILVAKWLNIPSIGFYDDPEKQFNFISILNNSRIFYMPRFNVLYENAQTYEGLKEWAYLSPRYFSPNLSAIKDFNLNPKKYIFIRDVSTNTTNYSGQDKAVILKLIDDMPKNIKVVLSLENKSIKQNYPSDWIILEEPVENIHSIMFYSKLVISSGDSVAREGGVLGVPSIYCGIREMLANKVLIKKGILFHLQSEKLTSKQMDDLSNEDINAQNKFREELVNTWEDIPNLISHTIENFQL